ncbi:lipopolysaccharide biosynthesis protein [Azospirillum sp. ST 5-10]|uniref:lipopolysaccharide biosynthesis protein n=1 Tax=unclassified Azospirillum TaxID=2630922 RepID=UPI003F4A0F2B
MDMLRVAGGRLPPSSGRGAERGPFARLIRNVSVLLTGKSLNGVLSLAYTALAARALGLEGLGLLVLVHAYAQAVGELAKFQSWQAVLRYGAMALRQDDTAHLGRIIRATMRLDLLSATVGVVVGGAVAWLAGPWLGWPAELAPLVALYTVSSAFMVGGTSVGVLRLFDRFDLLAFQNTSGSLVRLVGAALLYGVGGGLEAFLAVWFAATLVAGLLQIASAWRELRRRGVRVAGRGPRRPLTADHADFWRFVWSTNLTATIALAPNQFATLGVGFLLGPAAAGLYRIARQLGEALTKPAKLLVPVIYPEFARLSAEEDLASLRRLVLQAVALSAAVSVAVLAVLAAAGEAILVLIAGPPFAAGYPVMLMLGVAASITLWSFPLEPLLMATGRVGPALRTRLASALTHAGLLVVLVWAVGLNGAGLAAIAGALTGFVGLLLPTWSWLRRAPDPR